MTKKQKTAAGILCLIITMFSPVFFCMDNETGVYLFILFLFIFGGAADILLTEN